MTFLLRHYNAEYIASSARFKVLSGLCDATPLVPFQHQIGPRESPENDVPFDPEKRPFNPDSRPFNVFSWTPFTASIKLSIR